MANGTTKSVGISGKKRPGIIKRLIIFVLPLLVLAAAIIAFMQMGN